MKECRRKIIMEFNININKHFAEFKAKLKDKFGFCSRVWAVSGRQWLRL